jgi:hypothetical protein
MSRDSSEAFLQLHRAIDDVPDPQLRARLLAAVDEYERHRASEGSALAAHIDGMERLHARLLAEANGRAAQGDKLRARFQTAHDRIRKRWLEGDESLDAA